MSTVLVTGGSGFIAGHAILQLLATGHEVRTTVRDLAREAEVRATLARHGAAAQDRLRFLAADLNADAGWRDAAAGCRYVLHMASPLPATAPRHADELVIPARDGTLRVLRAARDAGVERVVLTSSFAAIGYGHGSRATPYDETSWTNLDREVSAYARSKTLAERAAWQFLAAEGGGLTLAVINPVAVLGPVLGADFSSPAQIVRRMLDGEVPVCPRLWFGVVDVRDTVELHLRAMTAPRAAGERFLATAGPFVSMLQLATVLRRNLGRAARRVPRLELPDAAVRLMGLLGMKVVRQILPEVGVMKDGSNAKARELLGWAPRSSDAAILATAESMLRLGLVRVSSRK